MNGYVRVATLKDLDDGTAKAVEVNGTPIALFRVADRVSALENFCPHAGYTLHDGCLEGTTVTCLLHGAEFDVATGTCVGGLACDDIVTYEVMVDEQGVIWVRLVPTSDGPVE